MHKAEDKKGGGICMQKKKSGKIITLNRKARHDYFVDETYEAGIELFGTEVKSLRAGTVNLKDSYCRIINGELFAFGVHIRMKREISTIKTPFACADCSCTKKR